MKAKEMLVGNMGFKLLSIAIAVSLWFFITYRGQSETTVDSQLEFKNMPQGLEILKQSVKKVTVNIRALKCLGSLKPADVRVMVDLSNGKKGEASYYFDTADVKIPANVKILRIDPTYVRVTLDESLSREIEIKPYVVGQPAKGYEIYKITVNPPVVLVEGPKAEMARLSILRTEPLDITGRAIVSRKIFAWMLTAAMCA